MIFKLGTSFNIITVYIIVTPLNKWTKRKSKPTMTTTKITITEIPRGGLGKKRRDKMGEMKDPRKKNDSRMGKSLLYLAFQKVCDTSFCVNKCDGSGLKVTDS